MKVKNNLNAASFQKKHEVNRMPSMTVPDQTMSVQEILKRYAQGLPLEGQKVPIYDGEDFDLPDPRTLDLADRQRMREDIQEEIQSIQERHKPKPPAPPQPPVTQSEETTEPAP